MYIVDSRSNYFVAWEPSLVSMATLNGFILLTAACRSIIQRERIAAIYWQQWLRERTTFLHYTYIAYILRLALGI